jgi:hypothetical protein
VNRLRKTADT